MRVTLPMQDAVAPMFPFAEAPPPADEYGEQVDLIAMFGVAAHDDEAGGSDADAAAADAAALQGAVDLPMMDIHSSKVLRECAPAPLPTIQHTHAEAADRHRLLRAACCVTHRLGSNSACFTARSASQLMVFIQRVRRRQPRRSAQQAQRRLLCSAQCRCFPPGPCPHPHARNDHMRARPHACTVSVQGPHACAAGLGTAECVQYSG